jgi:hypothetical protein
VKNCYEWLDASGNTVNIGDASAAATSPAKQQVNYKQNFEQLASHIITKYAGNAKTDIRKLTDSDLTILYTDNQKRYQLKIVYFTVSGHWYIEVCQEEPTIQNLIARRADNFDQVLTLLYEYDIIKAKNCAMLTEAAIPGSYGNQIFSILDSLSGDDITSFLNAYVAWRDFDDVDISNIYRNIGKYLETSSGQQLFGDLCNYFEVDEVATESFTNFAEEFDMYNSIWDEEAAEGRKFRVMMIVDDEEYPYGTYDSQHKANEIAMYVRAERGVETYVEECY